MKRIFIYPNTSKENIDDAVSQVVTKLFKYDDIHIFLPDTYLYEIENTIKKPMDFCIKNVDLIITLGGDGTMLTVIDKSAYVNVPVIGINVGNLGFLTELDMTELDYLDKVFKGEYLIDERMMLDVQIIRDDEIVLESIALNDIIIKTDSIFRIMTLDLSSDDTRVLSFDGDGVIISTPTGSTAYSMSAGGPIIEPEALSICVTPICSHKFTGKTFVFSKDRTIKINPLRRNSRDVFISCDGNDEAKLIDGDTVLITTAVQTAKFIRVKGQKFYHVLQEKIGGSFKNEI